MRDHVPDYVPPSDLSFKDSAALFRAGTLKASLGREYTQQCRFLCFAGYPGSFSHRSSKLSSLLLRLGQGELCFRQSVRRASQGRFYWLMRGVMELLRIRIQIARLPSLVYSLPRKARAVKAERKVCTEEFKREAIRLAKESGNNTQTKYVTQGVAECDCGSAARTDAVFQSA